MRAQDKLEQTTRVRRYRRGAFTLVEILVVVAVISILAALLFPAFMSARAKARQTACISNLRQLGLAMTAYSDDYDGLYAWAGDPADLHTNIWQATPYMAQIASMRPLTEVLNPYVKSPQLWRCSSDTGFDRLDMSQFGTTPIELNARPTMFEAFQTSYLYRTEITVFGKSQGNLTARDNANNIHEAAEINVLMDGNGFWHGTGGIEGRRFSVLMGDGHVVSQGIGKYFHTWSLQLDR